jgi:hypothetical protein
MKVGLHRGSRQKVGLHCTVESALHRGSAPTAGEIQPSVVGLHCAHLSSSFFTSFSSFSHWYNLVWVRAFCKLKKADLSCSGWWA